MEVTFKQQPKFTEVQIAHYLSRTTFQTSNSEGLRCQQAQREDNKRQEIQDPTAKGRGAQVGSERSLWV